MAVATKTLLPFRAERRLFREKYPEIVLHYRAVAPGGVMQDMKLHVGPPEDEPGAYYRDPLGVNILRLMKLYYDLEAQLEGLVKERDQAREELQGLRAAMHDMQSRVNRAEGQMRARKEAGKG